MLKVGSIIGTVAISLLLTSTVSAISPEEAKAKGLVGEKPNGYLGVVTPSPEVQALTNEAIQNTRPENLDEGPSGWMKNRVYVRPKTLPARPQAIEEVPTAFRVLRLPLT